MAPCWPQAVKGSGAYYSSGLKMWEQKHSSTAWIVGIYRPERLISEHLRDLTKQFRLCIFSAAWRCRQVGKDTHTHTRLHTWKHPFSSIVLHAIVLSAFRSTSVIHQRGALTFRLLSVRRPLPHSTDELVVHSRLQNGSRSIQKECITVEWMISKETRSEYFRTMGSQDEGFV